MNILTTVRIREKINNRYIYNYLVFSLESVTKNNLGTDSNKNSNCMEGRN